MRIEIDEEVDVMMPNVVDDDGDPVAVTGITWSLSPNLADGGVVEFIPDADNMKGIIRAVGTLGSATLTAIVSCEGGTAAYTADIEVGLSIPVGGPLTFGTPRKK